MNFLSSPVLYPPSSSPPAITQKRKLFQTFQSKEVPPKKPKVLGGFIHDEDSDDEEGALLPHFDVPSGIQGSHSALSEIDCNVGIRIGSNIKDREPRKQCDTPERTSGTPLSPLTFTSRLTPKLLEVQTSSGATVKIARRSQAVQQSYEQTIAQRSVTAPGRAKTAYYGIDIHKLIDDAKLQKELDVAAAEYKTQNGPFESVETSAQQQPQAPSRSQHQMWTEKYRAKKFTELVGDERTHRSVLRWLKSWDSIVFPGNSKAQTKNANIEQEQSHRKILLLTGPPGLGKTTLAHVCAKQAGYEVLEINASDDRSRDVVRGRIKDALGTETVRGLRERGKARRAARPVCVVVDEVDGVVTGSGGSGGDGGFMKALIDLVQLDQRNSNGQQASGNGKKKGDKFRLMRPLMLICNDVYAPSLRPLRQSSLAEIIHVRKPAIDKVISRMKTIFEKESIGCDNDAVRRLCESSWGMGTRKQNSLGGRGAGDGDIRGVLVHGEWMAHKLRAFHEGDLRLTRKWVEDHMNQSSASHDGLGRGGVREVVERVFVEGAGLPNLPTALSQEDARLIAESKTNPVGVADLRKRSAISALRAMIDTTGDHDRLMTECFTNYPTQVFQDDTLLSKPNAGYEWLHFHDMLSSRVYSSQEWELNPYLSTSACGFHDLFAAMDKGTKSWSEEKARNDDSDANSHPFSGFKADFAAYEAEKVNRTTLTEMQAGFSASMLRLFSSLDTMATELVSSVSLMLAPDVKPVVVGGSGATASVASVRKESEKKCVHNAVRVMHGLGVEFEKIKIESEGFGAHSNGGFALRMEPPLDNLSAFHFTKPSTATTTITTAIEASSSLKSTTTAPVRYAVRQVLAQELAKHKALQASIARQARAAGLSTSALRNHPSAANVTTNDQEDDANDKENNGPTKGLNHIERITAIAAATATLASAPGSATLLPATVGPVKKDFFGRPISLSHDSSRADNLTTASRPTSRGNNHGGHNQRSSSAATTKDSAHENAGNSGSGHRTWVSFHEGYSNAVRKYISMKELMDGF